MAASLPDAPSWLDEFADYLTPRHHPARACAMLTRLGRLLTGGPAHPQVLLTATVERDVQLGLALEDFFTSRGMALATDRGARRAARRRQARIRAVPEPLRPAVAGFEAHLRAAGDRARRAGTRPRGEHTLDVRLATVRDLAGFLAIRRDVGDWAAVTAADIEAFLATRPSRRASDLAGLRQFFAFAVRSHQMLIDPTRGMKALQPFGFRGPTLTIHSQRQLFGRWTEDGQVHPHEALVGLLALLHGASTTEILLITDEDINPADHTVRLGHRPHPIPLDPYTWTALQHVVTHRRAVGSTNPHVIVTARTRATRAAASDSYIKHTLDPAGIGPRILRSSRLVDLIGTIDAKLVAVSYGMTNQGVVAYLTDHVDTARLANT